MSVSRFCRLSAVIGFCLLTSGCGPWFESNQHDNGGGAGGDFNVVASNHAGEIVGVTAGGVLASFDPGNGAALTAAVTITGLGTGETVHAIDFRPTTGELYALTSASKIYKIDATSGIATVVGTAAFTPVLVGTGFDMDFDPVSEKIRVVSNTGQNLRISPDDGTATSDPALAFASTDTNVGSAPNVIGAGYAQNFVGATTTTLYAIDSAKDILITQGNVNATPVDPDQGTLFTVGSLGAGVDAGTDSGFDISEFGGAFLMTNPTGSTHSRIYSVNLQTGAARLVGDVTGALALKDIAVRPAVTPRAFGLTIANRIVTFRPGTPETLLTNVAITGMQSGESMLAIDVRPGTGEVYGVGSTSRLYKINATTGAATAIGTTPFASSVNGTAFDIDFDPVNDRARLVSDADQNVRLHPGTGATAGTDTALAYEAGDSAAGANPNITAIAQSDNAPGVAQSTVYGIDSIRNTLVRQGSVGGTPNSANTGQLATLAALSVFQSPIAVDPDDTIGFDISPLGGAFVSFNQVGSTTTAVGAIDLSTGVIRVYGFVATGTTLRDVALDLPAKPLMYALTATNTLVSFPIADPTSLSTPITITGLQASEQLLALDVRPSTRTLYGIGSTSRVYRINEVTGVATALSSAAFSPTISGTGIGADFNPVSDRLRVTTGSDQNLAIDPATGLVAATDTNLAYASGDTNSSANPAIAAVAYTNAYAGAATTTLYGLDSGTDSLVLVGSIGGSPNAPASGILSTVAQITISGVPQDISEVLGLDISPFNGAFCVINTTIFTFTTTVIGSVNLTSGVFTPIGAVPSATGAVRSVVTAAPGM